MRTFLVYVVASVPYAVGFVVGTLSAFLRIGYANGFYRWFEDEAQ